MYRNRRSARKRELVSRNGTLAKLAEAGQLAELFQQAIELIRSHRLDGYVDVLNLHGYISPSTFANTLTNW